MIETAPTGAVFVSAYRVAMSPDANLDALLRLLLLGGASAPKRRLLDAHDSPAEALQAGIEAWHRCGLSGAQFQACASQSISAEYARCVEWTQASPRRRVIGWSDPDYPPLLRHAPSPPLALFVAGDPTVLWHPGIAVVGSRSSTMAGCEHARDFATAFVDAGFAVISGMAAGIDTRAHEAALSREGLTIAVVGTGPDVVYPQRNADLHARICAKGVVVSEYLPGTSARREHFPQRNRILAGLALGTLVVEAAERSGALITARLASECGREVFAIPGSIHNLLSRGCHRLIREGASLVQRPQDVIEALSSVAGHLGDALRQRLDAMPQFASADLETMPMTLSGVDSDYYRLWEALGHDPTGTDLLVERSGLTAAAVSSMLLTMELQGQVEVAFGRYTRTRRSPA